MLATAYHCRPSEIVGIPDEWAAYQFDVAAYTVGQQELNELQRQANEEARQETKKKGKRKGKGGRGRDTADAQPMPSSVLRGLMKT